MNVSASTVRKSSRIVSLGVTAMVVAYAVSVSDLSGGFWIAVLNCFKTMFSMLPWWTHAFYGGYACHALVVSALDRKLKWGVGVSSRYPDRVTVWGILLWAMLLPAEIMVLLVAWPFMLGRLTIIRTIPDRR